MVTTSTMTTRLHDVISRREVLLRAVPALSALTVVVSALWGRVALYADGSNYLYWILRRRTFYWSSYEHFLSRSESQVLTQAPVRLALALHLYPLPWLTALYGVGLFVLPNALWMTAIYRQREAPRFWFFAALYALTLCTQFYAVSESLVTYGLVALVASLLMDGREARPSTAWVVSGLSALLIASYEITLVMAPLLGFILLGWWWRSGMLRTRWTLLSPVVLSLALLFSGTVLSFVTIRSHAESAGPSSALSLHFLSLGGGAVVVGCLVIVAVTTSLYASGTMRRSALLVAGLGVIVLVNPGFWEPPNVAYYARVDVGLMIALALALAAPKLLRRGEADDLNARAPLGSSVLASALVVLLTVSFAANAAGFGAWNRSLQRIVTTHHGVLPFFSGLGKSVHQFYRYGWFWTTPEQSLLDQTARHQAVVNNPSNSQNFEIVPGTPSSYLSPRYFSSS